MAATTPTNTTLSAALNATARTFAVASATGIAADDYLVVGAEMMKVLVVSGTRLEVQRGIEGTRAVRHASGSAVYRGAAADFVLSRHGKIAIAGYTGNLNEPELPIGSRYFDPDSGNEYLLVESGAAFVVGEWVVISGAGAATQLAIGSRGRVGIVVESGEVSDTLIWVLVRGTFASALFDSDVTTVMADLGAAAGFAAPSDSDNHTIIHRAICTVAPSTATSPTVGDGVGTAYIDNPWVEGPDFVS